MDQTKDSRGNPKLRFFQVAGSCLLAVLPSRVKLPLYRLLYGYHIGKGVKIGFGTALIGVHCCRIGDHVRIGCFNLFVHIQRLEITDYAQIGYVNLFRGGDSIRIGAHATILRLNVFNSILRPDAVNPLHPVLELGTRVVITTGHWLDFTDRLVIGASTVIGGRNSSFWTHSRQRTRAITVGPHCYLGSEVRAAPGVEVPASCIVGLGSVLIGRFTEPRSLIAGNPAKVLRALHERELFLVGRTTCSDAPHQLRPSASAVTRGSAEQASLQ
jgi:acetyltransferase-like isoleucine patch superfamily enzyme